MPPCGQGTTDWTSPSWRGAAAGAGNPKTWFQNVISSFKPDSEHAWMGTRALTPCCCPSNVYSRSTFHTGASPQARTERGHGNYQGGAEGAVGRELEGTGITKVWPALLLSLSQHRLQGGHSFASCPHGSHQQPSQSAASLPTLAQTPGLAWKRECEPNPSKSVCKCRVQQKRAGSAYPVWWAEGHSHHTKSIPVCHY